MLIVTVLLDWEESGETKQDLHQWEDNWEDDDHAEDDFSVQLRYVFGVHKLCFNCSFLDVSWKSCNKRQSEIH
jgi:hypothetical protein